MKIEVKILSGKVETLDVSLRSSRDSCGCVCVVVVCVRIRVWIEIIALHSYQILINTTNCYVTPLLLPFLRSMMIRKWRV